MKKFAKLVASLLAVLTLVFAVVPTTSAASATEVLKAVSEKSKEGLSSLHAVGNLKGVLDTDGTAQDLGAVTFDGQVSIKDPFVASFMMDLTAFGSQQNVGLIVKDGVVYESHNGTWLVAQQDASAQIAEFQKTYQEALAQQSEGVTDEQLAVTEKYMDFSETDDAYVFTLKQDIKADELWNDINSAVDVAKIKEQVVANYKAQGIEWTDENQAMFDSMLSQEGVEAFLAAKPQITISYDKTTYNVKAMTFSAAVDVTELYGQMMTAGAESESESTEAAPKQILNISGEFTFDKYGEAVEVQTPEVVETTAVETTSAE